MSLVFENEETKGNAVLWNKTKYPIVIEEYSYTEDVKERVNDRVLSEILADLTRIINNYHNIELNEMFPFSHYEKIIAIQPETRGEGKYHNIPKCKRK